MTARSHYVTGWMATSIRDFLGEIGIPPKAMSYTLITSLDSGTDVDSMAARGTDLQHLAGSFRVVGHGLLIRTRRLIELNRLRSVFVGFDEVWFFPNPIVEPKPDGLTIVRPGMIDEPMLAAHEHWLNANHCSLGLGDGEGTNYCLKVTGAAKLIVRAMSPAGAGQSAGDP